MLKKSAQSKPKVNFDNLTPAVFPITLPADWKTRTLKDFRPVNRIVAPIATGQRALIVAPPRTGKPC